MSIGEVIGLTMLASVLGGLIAAAAATAVTLRRRARVELRARRIDAFAGWLAARHALTRASMSFVAAFRTLAAEPRKSRTFPLRLEEAQRARNQWGDALAHLELAESELLAWSGAPALRARLALAERPTLGELRRAVRGDDRTIDELAARLRQLDGHAMDLVTAHTTELMNGQGGWQRFFSATKWHVQDILNSGRRQG